MDANRRGRKVASIFIASATTVAVTFVLILTPEPHRTPVASVDLADGRTLQIDAVAFGKNESIGHRSWVLEHFRPWLPLKLVEFFSPAMPYAKVDFPEPRLVLWTSAVDSVGKHVDCQSRRLEFVDEQGDLFGDPHRYWFGFAHFWRVAYAFDAFPRDAQTLKLQITPWKSNVTSRVKFTNPAWTRSAPWRGLPLPQARLVNNLEIELQALTMRTNGVPDDTWVTPARYWEPIWKLNDHGKPVSGWSTPEWTAADALGNTGQHLGIHCPIIKFSVTIYPQATNFESALCLTNFPAIDLNSVTSNIWWNTTLAYQTNQVTALGVLPPGVNIFSEGVYISNPVKKMAAVSGGAPSGWITSQSRVNPLKVMISHAHYTRQPTIYLHVPVLPPGLRLAIRLRDQRGIYWPAEAEPEGPADGIFPFIPHVPPEIGVVIPELVVLRPISAEFSVLTGKTSEP